MKPDINATNLIYQTYYNNYMQKKVYSIPAFQFVLILLSFALMFITAPLIIQPAYTSFVAGPPINQNNSDIGIKVEQIVMQKLESNNEVPVIIKLSTDLEASTLPIKVTHEFETINAISGNLTKKELEMLENDPRVESIEYDRPVYAFLQNSANIINAPAVHAKKINSINITGRGETICIIDTGINYNHPDLGGCFGAGCKIIGGYDFINNDNDPIDDNGHGTSVAGIAAANGLITGISPEANLIAIKSLGSSGAGSESTIVAGINWCITNKIPYNISIISMSLGGGLYAGYCDDTEIAMRDAVNAAVQQNISVVAATGNSGSTSAIASPACIKNSTAVTATDLSDNFASFANRNSITDLAAPGVSINSTKSPNGYSSASGTSMATPHVAGIIALLNQYKKAEDGLPEDIAVALNKNGKQLAFNITRIDALQTLIAIDKKAPTIVVTSPQDKTYITNTISINYTSKDTNLDKTWYELDNNTAMLIENTSINVTDGNHFITIFSNDSNGNVNNLSINFYINSASPITVLNLPTDYFNTTSANITFNCSATSNYLLENITLYHNLSGIFTVNETANVFGLSNSASFTMIIIPDGRYIWNCLTYNNQSNFAFAEENYTIIIDTTPPILELISPENNTSTNTPLVTFLYGASDLTAAQCSLYINSTLSSINMVEQNPNNFTANLSNGNYNWNISCFDILNNTAESETRMFSVNATAGNSSDSSSSESSNNGSGSASSGGGGGGGGGSRTIKLVQPSIQPSTSMPSLVASPSASPAAPAPSTQAPAPIESKDVAAISSPPMIQGFFLRLNSRLNSAESIVGDTITVVKHNKLALRSILFLAFWLLLGLIGFLIEYAQKRINKL